MNKCTTCGGPLWGEVLVNGRNAFCGYCKDIDKVNSNYERFVNDLNGAEEFPGDRTAILLLTKNLVTLNDYDEDVRERYRSYIN